MICHLAYSLLTQKPVTWFRQNKELFEVADEAGGESRGRKEVYSSIDYRNIFNLVTHHQRMSKVENFHRAVFATFLLRCLESQGYFQDSEEPSAAELGGDRLLIGRLLFHLLEVLQFNTHEVAQLEMHGRRFEHGAKSQLIGAAVYPTLALFNHSCEPSLTRFFSGSTITVQTIKTIKKGEEIFENYGPLFFHSRKSERRERLKKQYWFDCCCPACEDDWPILQEMDQAEFKFRSLSCEQLVLNLLRCSRCSDGAMFNMSATTPALKCSCGANINMLTNLKVRLKNTSKTVKFVKKCCM